MLENLILKDITYQPQVSIFTTVEVYLKVTSMIMFSTRTTIKQCVLIAVILISSLMLPSMDIVQRFLLTGKLAQEKHTQWRENSNCSPDKYIKAMSGKA
jgi:hypothetical protein